MLLRIIIFSENEFKPFFCLLPMDIAFCLIGQEDYRSH